MSSIIPNNKSRVNNQGITSLGPDMGAMGGQTDDGSHDFLNSGDSFRCIGSGW